MPELHTGLHYPAFLFFQLQMSALSDPKIKKTYFLKLILAFQSLELSMPKGTLMKPNVSVSNLTSVGGPQNEIPKEKAKWPCK